MANGLAIAHNRKVKAKGTPIKLRHSTPLRNNALGEGGEESDKANPIMLQSR